MRFRPLGLLYSPRAVCPPRKAEPGDRSSSLSSHSHSHRHTLPCLCFPFISHLGVQSINQSNPPDSTTNTRAACNDSPTVLRHILHEQTPNQEKLALRVLFMSGFHISYRDRDE